VSFDGNCETPEMAEGADAAEDERFSAISSERQQTQQVHNTNKSINLNY